MSLEWREQLSVGNDVIDSDHKHLIEIINRIERSLESKAWEELKNALDSLSRYSTTHFAAEEKIASAVGYAQASRLHESHQDLLEKLDKLKQYLVDEWPPTSVEGFVGLLRDWLIHHVIKEDLLMKPFLSKRSPKFDPR